MKFLIQKENDNLEFIHNSEKIIRNRIELWKPTEIFIIRIDNWFDEKCMGFSGTLINEVSIWKGQVTNTPISSK